jgi:phenylalanyl-tRNA synthetase beta chain
MKISLKWLNTYIDIAEYFDKPDVLAEKLTRAGLEVESIVNHAKQFEHVVIGLILEKKQHPNADRLTLCQVSTGNGKVHQIVCGAKNHNANDRVVVALPGAILPGDFAIKRSQIRGVDSEGMLCSESELGLKAESEGILLLPTDAPIGESFASYQGLDDVVFELKVTPNRADCLSHFGLAREIKALIDRPIDLPFKPFAPLTQRSRECIQVSVEDSVRCPRYTACVIKGVKIGPSPQWLKQRLDSIGMKSINNVVDVTNFVMMELGQPLHAFDLRHLQGSQISVRLATSGEEFETFDGTKLKLDGTELTVRDAHKAVALAGVIGGKNSGVNDSTIDLVIESAFFRASDVRKTARRHGIETDSSYRFARGVDPEGTLLGLNRACELIQQVAGGEILSQPYDLYPHPAIRPIVEISVQMVAERMGSPVPATAFLDVLKKIGCHVEVAGDSIAGVFKVATPLFRHDLLQAVDLIEEYARLIGYEQIAERMPEMHGDPTPHYPGYQAGQLLHHLARTQGFSEALNFGFLSDSEQRRVMGEESAPAVRIKNPLNEELNAMRQSLIPGLIKNLSHNIRYGNSLGRIYEIGHVFFVDTAASKSDDAFRTGFDEPWRMAVAAWGEAESLWQKPGAAGAVFFQVKAHIENILKGLGARNYRWQKPDVPLACVHPGQTAELFYEGKIVGNIGTLHPKLQETLKLPSGVVLGEFDLDLLLSGQPRIWKSKPIGRFPVVERDLSFVMPKAMSGASVQSEIQKIGGSLLKRCVVFDVFEGGNLASGQKSLSFRLAFEDLTETISEERMQAVIKKVIDSVSQKFAIAIR